MSSSPIAQALRNIAEEKGLDYEIVLSTLESALAAAYRKDFGEKDQNIVIEYDPETGAMKVYDEKEVVEDQEIPEEDPENPPEPQFDENGEEIKRFNPKNELMITEAKKEKKGAKIGDVIRRELEIHEDFGRMAAQTAKQVITQKLREAERNAIYEEFVGNEGTVMMGSIGRRESRHILIDIGKATAVLPTNEQVQGETYRAGSRMKFYVSSVNMTTKGPEIVLSRAHAELVREVFTNEIPEISSGVVEIKGIAREAGNRSKVAVYCEDESIDPIGSCIGQRGTRIQTVISELGGEKVDLIQWSDDPKEYIIQALAPAQVADVEFNEEDKSAKVVVSADQFSLAIGRGGQNVRLAAKLTGWNISVVDESGASGADRKAEKPTADEEEKSDTPEEEETAGEKEEVEAEVKEVPEAEATEVETAEAETPEVVEAVEEEPEPEPEPKTKAKAKAKAEAEAEAEAKAEAEAEAEAEPAAEEEKKEDEAK